MSNSRSDAFRNTTNTANVTKTCLELKSLIIHPLQLDIMTSLKCFQLLFNVLLLSSYLQTILVWQKPELENEKDTSENDRKAGSTFGTLTRLVSPRYMSDRLGTNADRKL